MPIGGQILAKRLKKHILKYEENDSSWDSTEGLNFYYFNHLGNQTEFKNFYRERLNAAKVDAKTRGNMISLPEGVHACVCMFTIIYNRAHCC